MKEKHNFPDNSRQNDMDSSSSSAEDDDLVNVSDLEEEGSERDFLEEEDGIGQIQYLSDPISESESENDGIQLIEKELESPENKEEEELFKPKQQTNAVKNTDDGGIYADCQVKFTRESTKRWLILILC